MKVAFIVTLMLTATAFGASPSEVSPAYTTQCSRKNSHFVFVITSENINRFSNFFHRQISKKTVWIGMIAISTSP